VDRFAYPLATGVGAHTMVDMPAATKTSLRKIVRRRAKAKVFAHGVTAVPGSPLAGLEHLIGCVSLPRDPRSRREILRARYRADHNT